MTEQVKIKVMDGGHMPEKKTFGAAAYDCYARIDGTGEYQYYDPDRKLYYIPGINGVTTKTPLGFAWKCLKVSTLAFWHVPALAGKRI